MGEEHLPAEKGTERELPAMSLGQHLDELRWRLIKCLVSVAAAFVLCWVVRGRLWAIVQRPHVHAMMAFELETSLNFSGYFEPFVAQLKVCAVFALILASPILIYQIWAFVAPGLFPHERYRSLKLGLACTVCFAAGICFGYFLFVPVALTYLLRLAGGWAEPVLMISRYLSLVFLLTFALAVAFQTPVVVYYLVRWGVLPVESLQRRRKGVILGAFIFAAVITPPDPVTQMMMALTLIVLYDLGGLVAAPSRATFKSFFKFTGAILLVGAVFVAWFRLWPVADVAALSGTVTVGRREVAPGQEARVTRGAVLRTGEDGAARISFGGEGGPVVHLAAEGRLQVHGPRSLSLYAGDCLAANPDPDVELAVSTAPASVVLAGARAELSVPDDDTLTVAVFAGSIQVKAGGQTKRIAAGQSATFRRGGEPADLSDAEKRWQDLMEGEEGRDADPAQ